MRRTLLAVGSLAIGLVLQLVVLNGLHLPGGGVPDLVLLLVAVLAVTGTPVRGMITGFAAGLALDIAPPGSAVLGEYALTLCLVGWAAGRMNRLVDRSVLRALAGLAVVVALAEGLAAAISIGLDPAQFSLAHARQVLPSAVGYDLLLLPFLMYLALLARSWAEAGPLDSDLDPASMFSESGIGKPGHRVQPRMAMASGRPHGGWVATGRGGREAAFRHPASPRGLRPGHGVAGSAAGTGRPRPGLPAAPVNLRFDSKSTARRARNSGVIGNPVGTGLGRLPAQHPGSFRSVSNRGFRPHGGAPGGSASGSAAGLTRRPSSRPVSLKFGARRGDGTVGRLLGTPRPAGSGASSHTGSHGSALRGSALRGSVLTGTGLRGVGLQGVGQLDRTGRSALGMTFRRKAAPRFRTAPPAPARSRPKAAPKFRRGNVTPSPALSTRAAAGGMLTQRDLLAARRRQTGSPRLHLAASRRGPGLLAAGRSAGTARTGAPRFRTRSLARPGRPAPRQPRFGYGRRSVVGFLVARGIRGHWLASTRAGGRARVWLIGRRNGGTR
jgi:rod shape-determining protein MreD